MGDEIGSKMATDDERRRVAAALRWLRDSDLPPWAGYTYEVVMGYMPKVGEGSVYQESTYKEYVARLADLIEPGDMSHGCRDTVACDRDALLALADEMDKWALTCDHYDRRVSPLDVTRYARRVREALEVAS